ncbi:hypothetical protein CEXT_776191, partial [Caerostris extrusa]
YVLLYSYLVASKRSAVQDTEHRNPGHLSPPGTLCDGFVTGVKPTR